MDSETQSDAGPSISPARLEGPTNVDAGAAGKRRPVRRDPEKRRQQNIQAQKKYSESTDPCFSATLYGNTAFGLSSL